MTARLPLARLGLATALLMSLAPAAHAIPAFARRYQVSCQQCHHPIPRLTPFGEMFASHGFRMAPGEAGTDTIPTGDDLLVLPRGFPFALRVDAYAHAFFDQDRVETDLQMPYVVKLLSSATLSPDLSYYFYVLLNERGEVAGVEDAFVFWNDAFGRPVDLSAGQFQVSDPIFKRELRLPFEDYIVYRTRVGEQPANLTYDRGLMAAIDAAGFTLTLEAVNGNGIGPASERKRFDGDAFKNVFGHLSRDVVPGLRLGALGYWGRQDLDDGVPDDGTRNELWMAGADASVVVGALEVDGQYVHREDDRPTFTAGEPASVVDGGFVEARWMPAGARWYALGIWNRVSGDRPVLDFGVGGPDHAREHESAALGAGYLVMRNVRVSGELGWDFRRDLGRVTLGMTLGY